MFYIKINSHILCYTVKGVIGKEEKFVMINQVLEMDTTVHPRYNDHFTSINTYEVGGGKD